MKPSGLVLCSLLWVVTPAAVMGDNTQAVKQTLVSACYGCHAKNDAQPTGLVPLQTGNVEDMATKLLAFRSGELSGTVMNRISRGYSIEELNTLALLMSQPQP